VSADNEHEESEDPIRAFAVTPHTNSGGRNDATGPFHPGAQKFSRAYNCAWRQFDNVGSGVRKRFLDEIDNHCAGSLDFFAYFGHGIPQGLASADCYGKHLDELCEILRPKMREPFIVALYACSCGVLNGYIGKLRDALRGDVYVYGHLSPGHSYMNPQVSEEASSNSPTFRLLYPNGDDLCAIWSDALHYSDLWLRFPLMEDYQVDRELNGRRLMGKWEVTGLGAPRAYEFDWPQVWTGRDFARSPRGTVTQRDPKRPAAAAMGGGVRGVSRAAVDVLPRLAGRASLRILYSVIAGRVRLAPRGVGS